MGGNSNAWHNASLIPVVKHRNGEPLMFQFGVLPLCQIQENATPSDLDRLVQRLPALQVRQPTTSPHQLDDFVRRCEAEFPRQGSLQVFLQELAMPATATLERHVHTVPAILAGHESRIGEYMANNICLDHVFHS